MFCIVLQRRFCDPQETFRKINKQSLPRTYWRQIAHLHHLWWRLSLLRCLIDYRWRPRWKVKLQQPCQITTSHPPQICSRGQKYSTHHVGYILPDLLLPKLKYTSDAPSIVTEGQIDDAKGLVLDLLGWGVDPEHLVTAGICPKLLYRIFTDLNLCLPTNLVLFGDG